jgi:hypothetical protein
MRPSGVCWGALLGRVGVECEYRDARQAAIQDRRKTRRFSTEDLPKVPACQATFEYRTRKLKMPYPPANLPLLRLTCPTATRMSIKVLKNSDYRAYRHSVGDTVLHDEDYRTGKQTIPYCTTRITVPGS